MKITLYSKNVTIIFFMVLFFVCPGYSAERDITLQWDESIDAAYLESYRIYYYTTPGDAGALHSANYAVSYTLAEGSPIFINPLIDPKPITIPKSNTQITLHFSDNSSDYYFVATAVDAAGLESNPTSEISTKQYYVSVEPSAISFDPVMTGSASSGKTITIRNGSSADLYVSAVALAGTDASQFTIQNDNCSGKTVVVSGSCTVDGLFLPTAAGVKTAMVSIVSNAYNSASVSLRGESPGNAMASSSNATISEQTVTGSISGAPANYTPQTVISFRAIGVVATGKFSIAYVSLPTNPAFYEVINGVWIQIYPSNQSSGITNVALNGNTLSFSVTDNSASDGDPAVGVISDAVVVGTLASASVSGSGGGGGCFIATAAFGSSLDPRVHALRAFRDRYLLTNTPGRMFVSYYYRFSPPIAEVMETHESLKSAVRWVLLPVVYGVEYPFVFSVFILIPAAVGVAYRRRKTKRFE